MNLVFGDLFVASASDLGGFELVPQPTSRHNQIATQRSEYMSGLLSIIVFMARSRPTTARLLGRDLLELLEFCWPLDLGTTRRTGTDLVASPLLALVCGGAVNQTQLGFRFTDCKQSQRGDPAK